MKKTLYTLSFVAFFALVTQAQSKPETATKKEQATQATEQINADGTKMVNDGKQATDNVKKEVPKDGTRMAITEKGVPASKNRQATDNKEMKATEAKQPTKTDKK